MTGGMPSMPPDPGKFWGIRHWNPLKPASGKRFNGIWIMMSGGKGSWMGVIRRGSSGSIDAVGAAVGKGLKALFDGRMIRGGR
jgi:hypothetical protein